MGDSRIYSNAPSVAPAGADSESRGRVGVAWVAVAVAVTAGVLTWVAMVVAPWAARAAVTRGDFEDVYTVPIIAVVVVLVLDALAVILGFMALLSFPWVISGQGGWGGDLRG